MNAVKWVNINDLWYQCAAMIRGCRRQEVLRLLPGLVLAASLLFAAAPAAAQDCAPQDGYGYDVDVTIELPEVRLDRGLSRAQLGDMMIHGPDQRILGVTASNLAVSRVARYLTYPVAAGHCFWVGRVDITLRYENLDIYIAREYAPDSCAYRAILEHEKQHVGIARKNIQRYVPRIKSTLASLLIPKWRKPKLVASMAAGEAEMERIFDQLMAPIHREIDTVLVREQGKIDTPQSYDRVRRKCKKW